MSDHGLDVVMRTASRCNFPVNLLCWENVEEAGRLAKKYPDTRLVIDHLGIKQPFKPPVPDNPFSKLGKVLELASHDNVVIKITGVCTLSHRAFPFSDIWDPLEEVFPGFRSKDVCGVRIGRVRLTLFLTEKVWTAFLTVHRSV